MISQKTVHCTAGISHFMIYPNGDVYRCMADYNARHNPIFNVLDEKWEFYDHPMPCCHDACYAGCDIDWAKKFIFNNKEQKHEEIHPQVVHFDPSISDLWDSQTLDIIPYKVAHIVWSPTLICNYSCMYCGCAVGEKKLSKDFPSAFPLLSVDDWIHVWKKILDHFDYGVLTMSGGEPLTSPATIPVFKLLTDRFLIGLTTNASTGVMGLATAIMGGEIKPKRKINIPGLGEIPTGLQLTASLHPTSQGFHSEVFKGSLLLLKNLGLYTSVNLVGYPLQLYLAPEWKQWCKDHDIHFVLSPWCGTDNYGFHSHYTEEQISFLNSITPSQRKTNTQTVFCKIDHTFFVPPSITCEHGCISTIKGIVKNTSDCAWQGDCDGENQLKVGARLYKKGMPSPVMEFRFPFTCNILNQNEEYPFILKIDATSLAPDTYELRLDMVKEGEYWMVDKGANEKIITLTVVEK